jgi:hypothetical protein
MDKRENQNSYAGSGGENDPLKWKSLGFFSAEEYLLFIFKKTEKITAALYLVSGLLKDNEPMKWELRDRGMELMSSSFMASSNVPGDKSSVIQSLFSSALETISLLNVARISNLVSEMNHVLLVREIDNIVGMLRDRLAESAENAGYVLSESFFRTPDMYATGFKTGPIRTSRSYETGTQPPRPASAVDSMADKADKRPIEGYSSAELKKSQRQDSIVAVLKVQSKVTIKDFSKVIKDCSEKTIQRELIDLVEKGVVKKEGERRWSRYSLA